MAGHLLGCRLLFIQTEIRDMKKCLEKLARDYSDTPSKKKIKGLCDMASR